MDTLDKLHFIESDAVPKEGATCEPLSTSIQITHCCGCKLTQHFADGHARHRDDDTPGDYERRQSERAYSVELCPEHEKAFLRKKRNDPVSLRERCIDLIWEYILQAEDKDVSTLFFHLAPKLRLLPLTAAVVDTFRGIIGFDCWLRAEERPDATTAFLMDALHDVQECIAYHDKGWYSPRTSSYMEYFS